MLPFAAKLIYSIYYLGHMLLFASNIDRVVHVEKLRFSKIFLQFNKIFVYWHYNVDN